MNDNVNIREKAEDLLEARIQAAAKVSSGIFKLSVPIMDGDKEYTELNYDFNALSGWEFAKAVDAGTTGRADAFNITDTQALSLFAAAAGKCTQGIDATDVRERLGSADAITAIRLAAIFFNGTSLAGNRRITNG